MDTQDEDAKIWAESNGHAVIATASDKIQSRVPPWERPNLKPWMTEPDKLAQYDGIVAATQDRLSRAKWRDEAKIRMWAEDHGKQLLIVDSGLHWPPADDMELLRWEFGAMKARQEWEATSKRYSRMQRYLRDSDFLVGRPPFGYRIVGVDCGESPCKCKEQRKTDHKRLEPDPVTAPYVLGMVDRFLDGETFTAICEWLDAEGIKPPNGGIWQLKTIRGILRNTTLIGRRKDAAGKTILRFTPILDSMAKWRALQHKLDNMPRKVDVSPDTAMLTGLIYCGKCQGIMHRRRVYNVRKDGSRQYNAYYRCDGKVRSRSDCGNMLPQTDMDSRMNEAVMAYGWAPHMERVFVPGLASHDDDIAEIEAEIRELDLDAPDYLTTHAELLTERARLKALPAEPDRYEVRATGKTVEQFWASQDTASKRAWLLGHGWRMFAHKDDDGEIVAQVEGGEYFADLEALSNVDLSSALSQR